MTKSAPDGSEIIQVTMKWRPLQAFRLELRFADGRTKQLPARPDETAVLMQLMGMGTDLWWDEETSTLSTRNLLSPGLVHVT